MSDIRVAFPSIPPGFIGQVGIVLSVAGGLAVAAALVPGATLRLGLLAAAMALIALGLPVLGLALWRRRTAAQGDRHLRRLHADDPAAVFFTDRTGTMIWRNARAGAVAGLAEGGRVHAALGGGSAVPEEMMARLMGTALRAGHAEERVSLDGGLCTLRVHRVGGHRLLWRFEPLAAAATPGLLQLRIDGDGQVAWLSPALLERMDAPAERVETLLETPPLRPNSTQNVRLDGDVTRYWIASRPVGDGMRELTFNPVPEYREDMQFDWLPVPLMEIEEDGTISKVNRLARQLLSIEQGEDVALQSLFEGLGRQVSDWLADAFEGRALGRPEVMRASRSTADLFVQVTLDRVGEGGQGRMMAVLHDATEMKTLEAQFVQSQKMQAIGQLAGGVAHDFNNLLTAISGHCDLLLLRHDPGDQDFADLEQINQNANRAASLVGQLLAFSRKQNLRPETIDLRDVLADLTHLLNRLVGERVTLSFDHDPSLQMVRADKRQLEQVIMNLVVNARDAMPEGGTVRVVTRMLDLAEPERHDRVEVPPGRYAVVEVCDQGIGIPEDKITKIFEPFFTTKKTGEGTGLGLSTAYGIVKQTGGYIFARSTVGEGTTFSLYFPATERIAAAKMRPAERQRDEEAKAEGRILLVEDEAPVRAFAARALRLRGHKVLEAEHAEAALEICEDPDVEIDVFVTDVIMPGRDGPSWVREALETRPDVRVIFVSGYAEESFAENQAQIPQSTFLPKPFSLQDLTRTVEAQLSD